MFLWVQFLALFFSPCILSLCLQLLTHTLSCTIHLLMTYNYRCLLHLIEYLSYFTLCSHALVMSKLGQLRTCLISELLHYMQSCIGDVKSWATANLLKLNDNKTKLMLVTSKRTKYLHNLPTSITIGNAQVPFKKSVKNLGFTLDCHLTMNAHVTNIARTCYFELRRLASIRRFLTCTATATLVFTFVFSRIDHSNSLLFGFTHDVTSHLQRIQNYAARVILRLPMSSSITIHL